MDPLQNRNAHIDVSNNVHPDPHINVKDVSVSSDVTIELHMNVAINVNAYVIETYCRER